MSVSMVERSAANNRMPAVGEEVSSTTGKKYKLISAIARGGYGTVFETIANDKRAAIKVEMFSVSRITKEVNVLRAATEAGDCSHLGVLIDEGKEKTQFEFVVMPLFSTDLNTIRRSRENERLSESTAIRLAIQTCEAIEQLHSIGYVSRDIKPSNFVIGREELNEHRNVYMIDFGIALNYLKDGKHIPAKEFVGWRGTDRYASMNAHTERELGRMDDLISWFYMIVEFAVVILPWNSDMRRPLIAKEKRRCHDDEEARKVLLNGCPEEYGVLLTYIETLTFKDKPDYAHILSILKGALDRLGYKMEDIYDWEEEPTGVPLVRIPERTGERSASRRDTEKRGRKRSLAGGDEASEGEGGSQEEPSPSKKIAVEEKPSGDEGSEPEPTPEKKKTDE